MIEKFQQGGQLDQIFNAINSQPEQALQQLVQSGAKPEDIMKIVQAGVQQGKIKPEIGQAILQAMQGQKVAARHGIKLNYIKSLKNKCAEDEEVVYYKKGGSVKCGCKKKEEGGEVVKAEAGRMMQFVKANQDRKKKEELEKKRKGTWAETTKYIARPEKNTKNLPQDNAVPNEDIPSHDKKTPKKACGSKIKENKCGGEIKKNCNGAVAKFKAKCGSKLKKK